MPKPCIPTINEYNHLLTTKLFSDIESFSNNFIALNKKELSRYKWSKDPLHCWSRQWEYPYAYEEIFKFYQNNHKQLKILDAGSGITFFPFFISSSLPNVSMSACDYDSSNRNIFSAIQKNATFSKYDIEFDIESLQNLTYEADTFDIIYCISVLEHTRDYESTIKEFKRVLKSDAILILTFDISIDGKGDISPSKAQGLLELLYKYFPGTERIKVCVEELITSPNIITTKFIKKTDKNLLPWLSFPGTDFMPQFKNLTFFCQVFHEINSKP